MNLDKFMYQITKLRFHLVPIRFSLFDTSVPHHERSVKYVLLLLVILCGLGHACFFRSFHGPEKTKDNY